MRWSNLLKRVDAHMHRDWKGLADEIVRNNGGVRPGVLENVITHCWEWRRCPTSLKGQLV